MGHLVRAEEPVRFAEVLKDFIEDHEPRHGDLEQFRDLLVASPTG